MSKIYAQTFESVWNVPSASLAAAGSVSSGSFITGGYVKLVGAFISSASGKAGSALRVWQSTDSASNWDHWSDFEISACSGSIFYTDLVGNAVKVDYRNGATAANEYRAMWRVQPVVSSQRIAASQAGVWLVSGSQVDDAAFAVGSDHVFPMGALFDDVTPDVVDEGDAGIPRMGSDRVLYAQGAVAHDAADAGNPLKVGGKAETTAPAAVADADRVNAWFDEYGRLVVALKDTSGNVAALTDQDSAGGVDHAQDVALMVPASGGGKQVGLIDDAAFTPTTDAVVPMGATFDDVTPDSIDEGDIGVPRMSADRVLYMQGAVAHDAADSGNPLKIGGKAESTAPADVSDADRVDAWLDLKGRQVVALSDASGNKLALTDQDTAGGTDLALDVALMAPASGGGVQLGLIDDAAFTPGTSAVLPAAAEYDDATPDSVDEGDAGALRMSANRSLYVQVRDAAGNERGLNVDASGQIATTTVEAVVDDAQFTYGTTKVFPLGAVLDDVAGDTVDENDIGAVRMSASRVLRTIPGTEAGVPVQFDDTDKMAVSLYAKGSGAGDTAIGSDSASNLYVSIAVQKMGTGWSSTASLAAAGSATSGSFSSNGYARLVGTLITNASAKAGSGLRIRQGFNTSASYDYFTDFVPSACSGSAFSIEVVGNAAQVDYITDSAASIFRTFWQLRPV